MTLAELVESRFGGVLKKGVHEADGKACIIEAVSALQGYSWSDSPVNVRTWEIRPLNDGFRSDALRTEWLLRVYAAYAGARDWPAARQRAVAQRLVVLTVQRIIADLPSLPEPVRAQCRAADSLSAEAAAGAARAAWAAARAAAWAAGAAAEAAAEAAEHRKICSAMRAELKKESFKVLGRKTFDYAG